MYYNYKKIRHGRHFEVLDQLICQDFLAANHAKLIGTKLSVRNLSFICAYLCILNDTELTIKPFFLLLKIMVYDWHWHNYATVCCFIRVTDYSDLGRACYQNRRPKIPWSISGNTCSITLIKTIKYRGSREHYLCRLTN